MSTLREGQIPVKCLQTPLFSPASIHPAQRYWKLGLREISRNHTNHRQEQTDYQDKWVFFSLWWLWKTVDHHCFNNCVLCIRILEFHSFTCFLLPRFNYCNCFKISSQVMFLLVILGFVDVFQTAKVVSQKLKYSTHKLDTAFQVIFYYFSHFSHISSLVNTHHIKDKLFFARA